MFEPNAQELQAVIISQDMVEEISALSLIVNDQTLGVEISPLKIYCQKTGHIIGSRDENSLFSLVKIKGKNSIIPSLYNGTTMSVHPAWIETNGECLDILINDDPIGYACYCLGLITAQFYQNSKNSDRKRLPWIERYWAIARANALLTQRGVSGLTELNIELCKLLTYAPDAPNYFFKRVRKLGQTPDMLAMLHCTGELTALLKDCVNRCLRDIGQAEQYIQRTRYVDYAATPADAARGPSNIRQQKASKREVKEAGMFAILSDLFKDSGLDIRQTIMNNTPGTGAWKARVASNAAAKEAKMLQDLQSFGGTNLDFSLEDEEEDDNSVEVRTLARDVSTDGLSKALEDGQSGNNQEQIITQAMPPARKLTALEMLRAKGK